MLLNCHNSIIGLILTFKLSYSIHQRILLGVFHKAKGLHWMISDWISLCSSYDQKDGKVIGKGYSVDFGYKFVLCKSRGDPKLIEERCHSLLPRWLPHSLYPKPIKNTSECAK